MVSERSGGGWVGSRGGASHRYRLFPACRIPDEGALEVQHFSATTDLYQVASNVYQIKSIPVDLKDLIAVVVAALLPFLPVLLYEMPLAVILPDVVKLLL